MKSTVLFLTLCSLVPNTVALAEYHVPSHNCEIFIDKITPFSGSHGLSAARAWVKVNPSLLDGAIDEVGFRHTQTGYSWTPKEEIQWHNQRLNSYLGANDYYELNGLTFGNDWGTNVYHGAFYVKTKNATYYWAKTSTGDFTFDDTTYKNVRNIKGVNVNYHSDINEAVETQRLGMEYYNPSHCH